MNRHYAVMYGDKTIAIRSDHREAEALAAFANGFLEHKTYCRVKTWDEATPLMAGLAPWRVEADVDEDRKTHGDPAALSMFGALPHFSGDKLASIYPRPWCNTVCVRLWAASREAATAQFMAWMQEHGYRYVSETQYAGRSIA